MKQLRVISLNRDVWQLWDHDREIPAVVTGKLRFGAVSEEDFPVAGDLVQAWVADDNAMAIIHSILPRTTLLKRKAAGESAMQMIAANIDTALLVQALGRDFNPNRLERYLAIVHEGGISPAIVLCKSDRATTEERESALTMLQTSFPAIPLFAVSNATGDGIGKLKEYLLSGKIYCLLGSSGAGKTSLLNSLSGENHTTGEIREQDERGKHTTTTRHLYTLPSGAMILDNPGMRELGVLGADDGIARTFGELETLAQNCRFRDCSHSNEEGCAILQAVAAGSISEKRYNNWMKLGAEARFHSLSQYDKRQKDKKFGKMVKQAKKDKLR